MIPARLGSKRIKKKNLRLINNKPLISYVIEKAKKCKLFNEIYLNSDSRIFEKIAKKYGISFYASLFISIGTTVVSYYLLILGLNQFGIKL